MNFTVTMRGFCRFYVIELLWYLLEMSAMLWNNFILFQCSFPSDWLDAQLPFPPTGHTLV